MEENGMVLCAASAYEQKFYLNPKFANLPEGIREELQIMCVLFTEDVGGVLALRFSEDGSLELETSADEGDLLYDDIGSVLKIKQIRNDRQELLEALEMYYRVFFLQQEYPDQEA